MAQRRFRTDAAHVVRQAPCRPFAARVAQQLAYRLVRIAKIHQHGIFLQLNVVVIGPEERTYNHQHDNEEYNAGRHEKKFPIVSCQLPVVTKPRLIQRSQSPGFAKTIH